MKFPAGTDGGIISNPQDEGFIRDLMAFVGAIEIETGSGHGFILTENGKLISAYFRNDNGVFRGKEALSHMTLDSDGNDDQTFSLRRYDTAEFVLAVRISRDEHLLLSGSVPAPSPAEPQPAPQPVQQPSAEAGAQKAAPVSSVPPEYLDETRLRKILSQPGVIAVSAFFEGFPVQSIGDADFEHVAASAEDFMRAGLKITQEMKTGNLDQLILETANNKFIIAPCGDLYLCIFTTAEAQLGLIRVVLKSIQKEITG
ncbi:roadblock/LC7 domain-containing protein [Methanoregula sp.]|jgi:predicted regulator of Ras-like GTPase activity (Roadblock/LC7/MglB family)|uniref:roadblock/LC7 domain-containing protein n=1 Tax=Methanoregula sp. TaxID=2052170 RepID=UPI003C1766F7